MSIQLTFAQLKELCESLPNTIQDEELLTISQENGKIKVKDADEVLIKVIPDDGSVF